MKSWKVDGAIVPDWVRAQSDFAVWGDTSGGAWLQSRGDKPTAIMLSKGDLVIRLDDGTWMVNDDVIQ